MTSQCSIDLPVPEDEIRRRKEEKEIIKEVEVNGFY